ncbi:hypothetical protein HFC70_05420 [Agrobacterium sp. a22-2]|uniref:hypothetical protein n=1 Tax=Agrobacterium sp. a22-2 TaxID=2283840 RepID=UPI001445A71E|nr:hypothetical protein [Agrobacterium sp. a22-2]NKN35792.1 hypothetical protein [Agrobacterium sp. a22-2]
MAIGLRKAVSLGLCFLRASARVIYRLLQPDDGIETFLPDDLKRDVGYRDGRACRSRRAEIRDTASVWSAILPPRGPQ